MQSRVAASPWLVDAVHVAELLESPARWIRDVTPSSVFQEDAETTQSIMIGEIGGDSEERTCVFIKERAYWSSALVRRRGGES